VIGQVLRVASYRFRTTFRSRRGGYLSVMLLVSLVGGAALGAVAAARRTQSSFPAYIASTNPSDFAAITAVLDPLIGSNVGYDPDLLRTIAHLPHIKQVESASGLDVLPLGPNGAPIDLAVFPPAAGNGLGSVNQLGFDQDRFTVVQGRMADPRRANEMLMQTDIAQAVHLRVGAHVLLGIYTNAQTQLPGFGTASVAPYRKIDVTLTGTVVIAHSLVQDDVDNSTSFAFFTPTFTRQFLACCSNYTQSGIQVAGGSRYLGAVDTELQQVLPKGFPAPIVGSTVVDKAERAIKPESIALAVFGGIAALAALLIAAQVIGRQTRLVVDDLRTMRALGAGPATTAADGLIGILGAVVIGSVLAVAVAVGLSPLAPIGPVRPVDPTPGLSFDWVVLGLGFLVLVVSLGAITVLYAYRAAPRRGAEHQGAEGRTSNVTSAAAALGLPASAVTGVRFALQPGIGRDAVPVRSAILGAALAVMVVVTTVTFSASLNALVSHPRLYGWNWDSILATGGGSGNIPQRQVTDLLDHDRYVQAWSGVYSDDLHIDGQTVPVIGESPNAPVQPPVLSGHALTARGQVVLGAITLAQLHKHVGETVVVGSGTGSETQLQIVGTATMPTIGGPGPHLEMGTGALLPDDLIPAAAKNPFNDPTTGPEEIFVNFRPGLNDAAALRSLEQMTSALSNNFNFGVFVGSVLRPAEIVNYRSMGTTPAVLGAALATGAVVALGLTLVASVRRRRRDLALLKTLGFTRRQLASAVAWQSSVAVATGTGTVVGVPLGIGLGRFLWIVFAHEIHAVPTPSVPTLSIVLIAAGALVLANVVAAIPGRIAAQTPTAVLLRAE
jgi:hypothetical protein